MVRGFYSILLFLLFVNFGAVSAADCEKCCNGDKPMSCLFESLEKQRVNPKCSCTPFVTTIENKRMEHICAWKLKTYTAYGTKVPCQAFSTVCTDTSIPSSLNIDCHIGYPPPSQIMEKATDLYCYFHDEHDIYNIFLTCWLYDCEHRLKKPKKTIEKGGMEWCYPPMIKKPHLKYCDLYAQKAEGGFYNISDPASEGCVLAPLCDPLKENTINPKLYMPTNRNTDGSRKANNNFCERLCKVDGYNNGTDGTELCRIIPSCIAEGKKYVVDPDNKYQILEVCLPWCNETDSYVRSGKHTLRTETYDTYGKKCNPFPICVDEKVPPPYTANNPYAATSCIPPRYCDEKETPDTHFCTINPASPEELKGPQTAAMGTGMIVAIIGVVLLVVVIAVVAVSLVIKRRRAQAAEEAIPRPEVKVEMTENRIIDETELNMSNEKPLEAAGVSMAVTKKGSDYKVSSRDEVRVSSKELQKSAAGKKGGDLSTRQSLKGASLKK